MSAADRHDDPDRPRAARAGPTGTRAAIYERLRAHGEALTVRDVAEAFAVHPNVARTHLQKLVGDGLVQVDERKRPEGGRPARVYQADPEAASRPPGAQDAAPPRSEASAEADPAAHTLVKLLAELAERPARGAVPHPLARAHEAAVAEGQRLAAAVARESMPLSFVEAVTRAVDALRPALPAARVVRAAEEAVDVAGIDGAFRLLGAHRPRLARALERGLITGALGSLGLTAAVSEQGVGVLRLSPTASGARAATLPAARVDARGEGRDEGVARARAALDGLVAGQVLEVLADGPGAPAAFARWADRAGHRLLGVERVEDAQGPAVRLLLRRGG